MALSALGEEKRRLYASDVTYTDRVLFESLEELRAYQRREAVVKAEPVAKQSTHKVRTGKSRSKLTREEMRMIGEATGYQREIAAEFGVSRITVIKYQKLVREGKL